MANINALALATNTGRLSALDLGIVAIYLVGITLFGLRFRKRDSGAPGKSSLKSYFLADNTIPWWAIALSIVSAETSTLTIISVPGLAFAGNFGFLQVALGYMVGRVVVSLLFLPRYFAGEMLTAYQLIDRRFGPMLHKVTAGLFLITRAAAEGVRVFAVSIVVGIAIGTRDVLSIGIISALTLLYTFEGGMAAVIWTDVVQMAIYVGGTVVAIVTLGSHVSGGWAQIHAVAGAAGKFQWLNFTMNLTTAYTFWAGLLGGTFLTMASHGTDQLMVQRLLAARNLRQSQAALLSSGIVIFGQFTMFLLIGAGLFVFYGQNPGALSSVTSNDKLFPTFIVHQMPVGVAGLLVAAILAAAMSNLSAALNSLSSTTVVDFYVRWWPETSDARRNLVAKTSTLFWAIVLFLIAVYSVQMGGKGHVVEIGLSIAAVAYGCLLGVFLLGTLTKFANQVGTSIGMVFGFALNVWLWQGSFPVRIAGVIIPHIAFTWYVLIGAAMTFLVGAFASLLFRQSAKPALAAALPLLLFFLLSFPHGICFSAKAQTPARDFSAISALVNASVQSHKLPGAVVLIGHGDKVVFEQAYGVRKLAGEPSSAGATSPAEAMTEDTIFDMASLTKCLATATAIMQLDEAGKLSIDAPVERYLPAFNPMHDPQRASITLRMLLMHTSGEPADVDLKDPWGLAAPDRAEGFRRALSTPLQSAPGATFRYSDINFILLGNIVEIVSGQREDDYTREHIFVPLGMIDTRYHAADRTCGSFGMQGANVVPMYNNTGPKYGGKLVACTSQTWNVADIERIAPTQHDDEGKAHPETNPDFDELLRGTVHDPTTRRMGGVAGQAGLFSTAHDVSLFAQALLDRLAGRPSSFPLSQRELLRMTAPAPAGAEPGTIFSQDLMGPAPTLSTVKGQPVHALGWDINTAFSRPRGAFFATATPSIPFSPTPSFGHTGFTGTSLWMDPNTNTYVIVLANGVHPRGNPPISPLRQAIATAAAQALGLDLPAAPLPRSSPQPTTLTGIDVLKKNRFAELAPLAAKHEGNLRLGLLTNQTGLDITGRRTVDVLAGDLPKSIPAAKLVRLFSPEHGLFGKQDTTAMAAEVDEASGLPVVGLYGAHASDRHPSHDQLKDLDAVVIDIQDVGVRFYTYETVLGYFLEAAAAEMKEYGHALEVVVLDRPVPIGGLVVQGPVSDPDVQSYTNYLSLPVRHGMTLGELARYDNTAKGLSVSLTVISMQGWTRDQFFDQTGIPWVNPSPNIHNLTEATLYPGVAFLEATNVSVGRGTATPFEIFGAGVPAKDVKTGAQAPAWFHAAEVAAALNARNIPGARFEATKATVAEDSNRYPFHGQTIEAVHIIVTDRIALDTPELGTELLSALHRLYPTQFAMGRASGLIANKATMDALTLGDDPQNIVHRWEAALNIFNSTRKAALLY